MRLAALLASVALSALGARVTAAPATPTALVVEYDGIIQPIAAEFLTSAIARANANAGGADLVLFVLRTPGGLLDTTQDIVARMVASNAPVVVFVGPSGARAASAGFLLTLAADVAVMAPGTHIGAAHPVSSTGQAMDETAAKKAASDAAAYARSLAGPRGRNEALATEAVTESRAFTDREALSASPPLIDFVASDVADLLRQLNGRPIRRFDGSTVTVDTTNITVERMAMTTRQRLLSMIAHPQVATLLMTLGVLGLTVELWTPGAIVPGVIGGLCLLLAFFAFQVVPISTAGLLLLIFGLVLLLLELKVPSFGILGVGGTLAVVAGTIMLTDTVPGVPLNLPITVSVALGVAAVLLFLGRLALRAQKAPPASGIDVLVGAVGEALTDMLPGTAGQVHVRGEIWRAESALPITSRTRVRVTAVQGLTLTVVPHDLTP